MSPTQLIGWVGWHAAIQICWFCGRSGYDRRLDHKSRMKRELPVRIREGLGVQFPRATRLVITGNSRELLEQEVQPLVEHFLQERGLELSVEKTRITPVVDGFDFLGQNVRRFDRQVLHRPSRKNVAALLGKV